MPSATAVLYSGGLDSAILLETLSRGLGGAGDRLLPIYVDCGSAWQRAELAAAKRFIEVLGRGRIAPLVMLSMPTADLYGDHWSVSGRGVPDAATADDAVYLPGRNALLTVKPLVWCGMHGVGRLALATLESNPFPDAGDGFLSAFSRALSIAMAADLEIVKPFAGFSKRQVMLEGRNAPLAETFSCIAPRHDRGSPSGFSHCGGCNKCAERRQAFVAAGLPDETRYAEV